MNARELLIATLQGKPVPRVPVSPFIAPNNIYEMFHYIPEIDTFFNPPDFDLAEPHQRAKAAMPLGIARLRPIRASASARKRISS